MSSRPRLPATVIALGVTSLFTDIGSEMVFPLLPAFIASLGASATFLGLIEGIADATASLVKLASGLVSDRFDRRKPLVLFGYGVATIVRPLVAFATAPWHVLAVRVTDRVGKGIRSAPRDALIAAAVPATESGRAFGFHNAMDHTGAVLGPVLATVLLAVGVPLRTVFFCAVIPGALALGSALTARESHAETPSTAKAATERTGLSRPLRSYLAILALFSLGNSSDAFLLLRAHDLGISTKLLPLLWSAFHVSKVVSSYLGGGWSDRLPRVRVVVSGWIVYALTYLGFGFATLQWHVWALFIVYGCYYGLSEPAEKALVKELAEPKGLGRAYGTYNFIIGVSAIPAGLLTGWLWQAVGSRLALATGAVIALCSSVMLLMWAASSKK